MENSMRGRLIVIDGIDGCGKTTQLDRLVRLFSEKHRVKGISFPEYDKPSAALVKMYLNGDFSRSAAGVNAYAASAFYAVDRYASYKLYWEKDYLEGGLIIAGRYVSSNIIHQMSKLPFKEWDGFIEWLEDHEYVRLGLPRPDRTLLLDIPVLLSEKRVSERYGGDEGRKDIHERDRAYMEKCRECALYAAGKLGWDVVPCCPEDMSGFYSPDDITEKLSNIIQSYIV